MDARQTTESDARWTDDRDPLADLLAARRTLLRRVMVEGNWGTGTGWVYRAWVREHMVRTWLMPGID